MTTLDPAPRAVYPRRVRTHAPILPAAMLLATSACGRAGFEAGPCNTDTACNDGNPCNGDESCDLRIKRCRQGDAAVEWSRCALNQVCRAGVCASADASCDLFVDADQGDDSASGSLDQPLATVQAGVDRAGGSGAVCVRSGTYDERVTVSVSGSAQAPLVVTAVGNSVIRGFDVNADDVWLLGFSITTSTLPNQDGIELAGNRLIVANNLIHDTTGAGVTTASTASLFSSRLLANRIERTAIEAMWLAGADNLVERNTLLDLPPSADGINFFGDRNVFRLNRIEGGDSCFQTFDGTEPARDNLFEANLCLRSSSTCLGAGGATQGLSSRVIFRSNLCDGSGTSGVDLEGLPDSIIANNLFLERYAFYGVSFGTSPRTVIANNIFHGEYRPYAGIGDASNAGAVADYNLYFHPSGSLFAWSEANGFYNVDPLFLGGSDIAAGYCLRPDSPAIDTGSNTWSDGLDFNGRARLVDGDGDGVAQVDIGPCEVEPY